VDTKPRGPQPGQQEKSGQRRSYSKALKRQMVEATLAGGESVSVVARRYDVNANQLFRWRNEYRQGLLADQGEAACLLPVTVLATPQRPPTVTATPGVGAASTETGCLEVTFCGGHRLVVTGKVCAQALRVVLEALSR
jgi:transposase